MFQANKQISEIAFVLGDFSRIKSNNFLKISRQNRRLFIELV